MEEKTLYTSQTLINVKKKKKMQSKIKVSVNYDTMYIPPNLNS